MDAQSTPEATPGLFRLRNFRLLWGGEAISLLGDQFYMVALPWLVLQLTGDPLAVGVVLALGGIPRALFMLVGGAITDRFSPRTTMLVSNAIRLVLTAVLAVLVLTNLVQLWMLYIFALAFGLADAFFFPAQSAITPRLVPEKHLQTANAAIQGTAQLSMFLGPVLAGGLIALMAGGATEAASATHLRGTAIAFAFDALTFAASVLTLWFIRGDASPATTGAAQTSSVIDSIRDGLRHVWNDRSMRATFILIAVGNFLIMGALTVGIPVLADTRFPEGAAAFGILMSAFGGGSLLGTLLAMVLPQPPVRWLGGVLGVTWRGLGLGIAALGLLTVTLPAAVVLFATGLLMGYVQILYITWLQKRTPGQMMGRIMSLLMFSSMGLQPISEAVTGVIARVDPVILFVGGGVLMTAITLVALLSPALRRMGDMPETVVSAPSQA